MATADETPRQRYGAMPDGSTMWDGRARCLLCCDAPGRDHDWCAAAGGLVCDDCCREILSGEAERLHAAARARRREIVPIEVLVACAACPRAERLLVEDDAAPEDSAQLH